ncbi:MAG: ribosome maturation factor RimP [Thermodesulfobacteriota bacterium]|nr:ribosome maturation factor RimP [Thermodesulfobacteriota bacterium]
MPENSGIINEVFELAEDLLRESLMEIVDVEFLFEHGRWVLKLYIDKEGGITLDDCAGVSRELGDLIEVRNTIDYPYVLEVSSPGLNRPLRTEKDFIRSIGKIAVLVMSKPINNIKNFTGRIAGVKEGVISLLLNDNTSAELHLNEINKARLKYELKN